MKNQPNPPVTIGIPTYNRADTFLPETLESAHTQTYENLEIIVSDNGSGDRTEELVAGFRNRDRRIRYVRHDPPIPPGENANYCLWNARGEYFLLLHDDDLIDPDFIEAAVREANGRDIGFVHTGARTIDGVGHIKKSRMNPHGNSTLFEYLDAVVRGGAVTYFCNNLYKTEHLVAVGGFPEDLRTYQDVVANVRVACRRPRVDIEEVKASYRDHGSRIGRTAVALSMWCSASIRVVEEVCALMPEKERHFRTTGMRAACDRNYSAALRIPGFWEKMRALVYVYRVFGYHFSPAGLLCDRTLYGIGRRFGLAGRDRKVRKKLAY